MSVSKAELAPSNPAGLCLCGCGQKTPLAAQSHTKNGYVKGKPIRYVNGHNRDGKGNRVLSALPLTHSGVHRWLRDHHPKSGICEDCGTEGRTHYASVNGHVYTRNREDYAELCSSCHMKHDYAEGRFPSQAGKPKPRRKTHASGL